jgi:hypothetical protein
MERLDQGRYGVLCILVFCVAALIAALFLPWMSAEIGTVTPDGCAPSSPQVNGRPLCAEITLNGFDVVSAGANAPEIDPADGTLANRGTPINGHIAPSPIEWAVVFAVAFGFLVRAFRPVLAVVAALFGLVVGVVPGLSLADTLHPSLGPFGTLGRGPVAATAVFMVLAATFVAGSVLMIVQRKLEKELTVDDDAVTASERFSAVTGLLASLRDLIDSAAKNQRPQSQ